jgi:lipopolysaccharide heptosyltransferase I
MNILVVRLGALGDIVHTIPAAAALRNALPGARIDWVVEAKHRALLDLVDGIDRVIPLEGRTLRAWSDVLTRLRQIRYDLALDFQGLMKSAVLARASGAARVAGFSIWHLREKGARPFYSETDAGVGLEPAQVAGHVIQKNLRLLRVAGVTTTQVEFPIARLESPAANAVVEAAGGRHFALINPGAAWPNKRWPAERFGEVAAFLRDVRGLASFVLWGPGEEDLAQEVAGASSGAASVAPPTTIGDLLELGRAAALIVSGDTGPLHLAAAVGTPAVALFGPTDARRNGPWSPADVVISRYETCGCHYARRCGEATWCLEGIGVTEVTAAVQRRLGRPPLAPTEPWAGDA